MKQKLLLKTLLLLCILVGGASNAWADTSFPTTYSYGGTNWTRTNFEDMSKDSYYKSNSNTSEISVASISGIFTNKNITSNVVITLNIGTFGSGDNPTASKFSIYTSSACTLQVTAAQSGTLPTSKSYTNAVYTITQANAASFSDDLAIKIATGGKQIRLKSIKVEFSYTDAVSKKNTSLTLSPSSLDLTYGGSTGTLTATVTPEGESALTSPTVTWESDDESVATVSGGVVTPLAEGSCEITATYAGDANYNGSSKKATVTVTDTRTAAVSAITSINSIKTLYIGGKHAFTPVVTLADGLSASDVTYSYVSADPATIQINDDGTYTALKVGSNIDVTVTVTPIAAKLVTYKPVSATFQHNGAYKYSKPLFTPTDVTDGNFTGSMTLAMANDGTPTGPIYYTLDGEEPAVDKSNGTPYSEELTLTATRTVKARVIDNDGYYSTVTSATYTKVPANKDAIALTSVGQTLSFTDFSAAGTYGTDKAVYYIASDGDKYKWTGTDVGNYSGKTLQIKNNTTSYVTSGNITAPNGFKMTVTYGGSGSVDVYVGSSKQTAVNGVYYFPTNTAVTLKRGSSGTPTVSNITITALKPSRSVTFPDGNQEITVDGETITKTATVSPAGTATYSSSNTAVATVDENTGEVTAVKGGEVTITATVAADEDYEESKGTYKVTVNKAATTLAFDHAEETVELVDGTATFTATATPADGTRTITYSTDDEITVNSSTGAVTLAATGDYTIKANANATDKYLAPSEASYTLHVVDNRQPVVNSAGLTLTLTLTDALDDPIALNGVIKGDEGFLGATYTKAVGFSGTEVVTYATSDDTVLKIENGNEFTALKGGEVTVTVTVTSGGDKMFTTVEKEFTVTVTNPSKTATEIGIMDSETNVYEDGDALNLTYGTPFTLDVSATDGYEGTITKVLTNENIVNIAVSGTTYTITPTAVGTTTLTFSAAETYNYTAAANIELTINVAEAAGSTTTPKGEDYWIYQNTLLSNSLPSGWTGDGTVWYSQKSYGAVTATGYTSGTYDLVTTVDATGYTNVGVTFDHTGNNLSNIDDACNVYVKVGSNDPEKLSITNFTSDGTWTYVNSGEIDLGSDYDNSEIQFIFRYTPTTKNNGKWQIKNFKVYGTEIPSEAITVASSGFSTHCYQYPLDLDLLDEDVKAYIVTNVSGTNVTFKRITGTIKGGVPFILYGTAEEHTLYTAASSTNVPENNMLVGTLSPKYITTTDGDYTNFGMKGGKFVKAGNGVIGANKAYLQVLTSSLGSGAREFGVTFEDDVTGISETKTMKMDNIDKVYNLKGQKVEKPTKGLYIVNGHKVVIK